MSSTATTAASVTVSAETGEQTSPQRATTTQQADVAIIGAGVAGCALAVALGRQGRRVLLLERSLAEPDRIVGELLQPGGVRALEKLGLQDCLEGIDAVKCTGYTVIYHGKPELLPYPAEKDKNGVEKGPAPEGRSFHHGRFIMKLREAARATPNVTIVETMVTGLIKQGEQQAGPHPPNGDDDENRVIGVETTSKTGETERFFAAVTVVADGYASKFRREYHPHQPRVKSRFWGLEMIDAKLPTPYHGHVLIGDGAKSGPVLMYQIGARETRALIDIPEHVAAAASAAAQSSGDNGALAGIKSHMRNVVLPSLPECVQPAFKAALDSGRLRSMPNSFLPSATVRARGLIILGDALNMRHPLTGGGMTVAFNDVVLLRELLAPERIPSLSDADEVARAMRTFHWRRKQAASVINILAQALYSLFAADGTPSLFFSSPPPNNIESELTQYNTPDENLRILQRGCFRYFELRYHETPVALLGGLIQRPTTLIYHFFAVAFLAVGVMFSELPWYRWPLALGRAVAVLWTSCVVIMPYVFVELRR